MTSARNLIFPIVTKLYAKWTANTYTVTLDYRGATGGVGASRAAVTSGNTFKLPVPTINGNTFGGWFTAENGGGVQLTGRNGSSLAAWNIDDNITAYVYWGGTAGLTFYESYGTYRVTGIVDFVSGSVVIPDHYAGIRVTGIEAHAFRELTGLTGITIPEGVTTIRTAAFMGCIKLKSVEIPASVYTIGSSAFEGSGLTTVTISEGVTTIGDSVFMGCTGLKTVSFSSGAAGIVPSMFAGCAALTGVTIPQGVASIGGSAFLNCTALSQITIPKSVASVGYGAFQGCAGLKNLTISAGVASISESAFEECSGLTSLTLPDSVSAIAYPRSRAARAKEPYRAVRG